MLGVEWAKVACRSPSPSPVPSTFWEAFDDRSRDIYHGHGYRSTPKVKLGSRFRKECAARKRWGAPARKIPHPGGSVLSGSHVSGDPFVELSRASAMRMVIAVTRPTMVASPG
jgi:hypothetical protein